MMKRLTTDHPENNFESVLNFVYGKDGAAYLRSDGEQDDVPLHEWARKQCMARGCGEFPGETLEEIDQTICDCGFDFPDCPVHLAYTFACRAVHLRDRLMMYEDTGLMPEDVTDLMAAHGAAIEKLEEYRIREEKRAPKCYSADIGGGCKYLVPDGDDEPIDRCKKCPLCYGDKARHRQPANAPLTLEELRKMDGNPAWSDYYQCWGLVSVHASGRWAGVPFFLFTDDGCRHEKNIEQRRLTLYRRKPEEGTRSV